MDNLPAEILEIVFHQLSSLKAVQKCFNTSMKWRQIISNIFTNKSKSHVHLENTSWIFLQPLCIIIRHYLSQLLLIQF